MNIEHVQTNMELIDEFFVSILFPVNRLIRAVGSSENPKGEGGICLPGWDRVNWSGKFWGGEVGDHSTFPPSLPGSDGPGQTDRHTFFPVWNLGTQFVRCQYFGIIEEKCFK